MIAGGLAALTFLLKAPFSGVALAAPRRADAAAARAGRRRRGPHGVPARAFAAGIGLGIMEQIVRWNTAAPRRSVRRLPRRDPRRPAHPAGDDLAGPGLAARRSWSLAGVLKPDPVGAADACPRSVGRPACSPRRPACSPSSCRAAGRLGPVSSPSVAIGVGHGRRVARDPHRLGRPHQPRPVRHRRRRRHRRRQPRCSAGTLDLFLIAPHRRRVAGAAIALLVGLPGAAHQGAVPRRHDARLRGRPRQLLPQLEQLPGAHPRRRRAARPLGALRPRERATTMYLLCLAFLGLSILVAIGVRDARPGG